MLKLKTFILCLFLSISLFSQANAGNLLRHSGMDWPDIQAYTNLYAGGTNNNVGIGTAVPTQQLEIAGGNVYINNTPGVITTRKPDGTCATISVDNNNALNVSAIDCLAPTTPIAQGTLQFLGQDLYFNGSQLTFNP